MRMRWCRDCGGYIEFRDANGQKRDLPECCCVSDSPNGLEPDEVRNGFCQLTSCTVCGAPTFFIHHNEGRTWFDDIGWPWPKHKCFNSPVHETLQSLEVDAQSLLGIVLAVDEARKMVVRLADGREVNYLLSTPGPVKHLVRTLVVTDADSIEILFPASLAGVAKYQEEAGDNKVIRYGSHPLPGASQVIRRGALHIACEFCEETFATEAEKGVHLKTHPDWPCPYCSYTTLLSEELDSHVKAKHPARG